MHMPAPTQQAAAVARSRNPLRLLSSVRFGVILLTLIVIYASVFSAVPPIRGMLELTEMQAFQHWIFVSLVGLFCLTLAVTTWKRIRWNITNLGVLTVHTGLLILVGGSTLYFFFKIEGDVTLRSPSIELLALGPDNQVLQAVEVRKDAGWAQELPAFGGRIGFIVDNVTRDERGVVQSAALRFRIGTAPAEVINLSRERPLQAVNERLALQLNVYPAQTHFYDDELAALHIGRAGSAEAPIVRPLHGLPLHRERYLDEGYTLTDRADRPAPSKRTWPHLAGLGLPTGWLEHWRMPIDVPLPELPFDVQVTGYVPYIADMRAEAVPGGSSENPAINYAFRMPRTTIREPLFANVPAQSLSRQAPVEFRWLSAAAELAALRRPLAGEEELHVRIADPPFEQTYAITPGQSIRVGQTGYELIIERLDRHWQMASPELRGATSPVAMVQVKGPDQRFSRTVVQRYPEYSQDIDEQGKRRTDGLVDANIELRYRTSTWMTVAAGPDVAPVLFIYQPDGKVEEAPLKPGEPVPFSAGGSFTLVNVIRDARAAATPVIEPLEFRRPNMERALSALRLKFTGRGAAAGWSESRWCVFTQNAHLDMTRNAPRRPITVRPPGSDAEYEIVYSRWPREIGATLIPGALSVNFQPGRMSVSTWRSDFGVQNTAGQVTPGAVYTNQTMTLGGPLSSVHWTLFQSGADPDHWAFTVLGVGNREGIWTMIVGSVLVTLGSLYAFYVKPVIIRRRKQSALQRAVQSGRLPRQAPDAAPVI